MERERSHSFSESVKIEIPLEKIKENGLDHLRESPVMLRDMKNKGISASYSVDSVSPPSFALAGSGIKKFSTTTSTNQSFRKGILLKN